MAFYKDLGFSHPPYHRISSTLYSVVITFASVGVDSFKGHVCLEFFTKTVTCLRNDLEYTSWILWKMVKDILGYPVMSLNFI